MGKDPFIACEFEMGEIVKILLKDGRGKAHQRDSDGHTPLWIACRNEKEEIAKMLLKWRSELDLNQVYFMGETLIWSACFNGNKEIVKILLASGRKFDVDKKRIAGDRKWRNGTAAENARENGHSEIVDLVQEYEQNSKEVMLTENRTG